MIYVKMYSSYGCQCKKSMPVMKVYIKVTLGFDSEKEL